MERTIRRRMWERARKLYSAIVPADHLPDEVRVGDQRFLAVENALRYGLAPGTAARMYGLEEITLGTIPTAEIVRQKAEKIVSYSNMEDAQVGVDVLRSLERRFPGKPACVYMKHAIPFGAALGESVEDAFEKAWKIDPVIPFGSVIAVNGEVSRDLAAEITNYFIDGVVATSYAPEAVEEFARKDKSTRLIAVRNMHAAHPQGFRRYVGKMLLGGFLLTEKFESPTTSIDDILVRTDEEPSEEMLRAALLQLSVMEEVRSNAAVFGDDKHVYAVGAGQGSRVDAILNAGRIASDRSPYYADWGEIPRSHRPVLVVATDGFPPDPDFVYACHNLGITGILSPIGSNADSKVYKAAVERGITMMTTRHLERPFVH